MDKASIKKTEGDEGRGGGGGGKNRTGAVFHLM